ncbi:MAG: hypothetical protein RBT62_10820 [Spirochaetia bacterium]|nr:hypothetical protein [Spirochaetia bacterium]
MADGNKDTRRRFGRRGRGRAKPGTQATEAGQVGEREAEHSPVLADQAVLVCSICSKQIFDLSSALAGKDGTPVHFDCALAEVSEGEHLEESEKVAYIGRGAFAVVEYKDKSLTTFTIKRRIQWEKEGEKFEWRRDIQQRFGF